MTKTNKGWFKKGRLPWSAGKKLPPEFGRKISLAKKGKTVAKRSTPITQEERLRMGEAQRRRWENESPEVRARRVERLTSIRHLIVMSPEGRERNRVSKLGNSWNKGKVRSEEFRLKLSQSLKGRIVSEATILKAKTTKANWSEEKREENRRKIGLASLGRIPSAETRAKIALANKGKKRSVETRIRMSLASPRRNPNRLITRASNKVIRKALPSKLWREAVFKRDDWTCQKCRMKGFKLHPHHIQSFSQWPELRFELSNGITFCVPCHKLFHKVYGIKDINQDQVTQFINDKVLPERVPLLCPDTANAM